MVACRTVCLRRLARGSWSAYMGFWRLLANRRVSVDKLVAGWSDQAREAAAGRHVLAIQDTSEIVFATSQDDRRGLGKVKRGNVFGVLLHAMMALDAERGTVLGLVGGKVWTRHGDNLVPHGKRRLNEKESGRWIDTAAAAKETLAQARLITIIGDRESDIYAHWGLTPGAGVHLLTRLMHDHAVVAGGTVRKAVARHKVAATAVVELRQRPDRKARKAHVSLRFTALALKRPQDTVEKNLPARVAVNVVEVIERHPPKGAEPVHWILLTTHQVATASDAWRVVEWYKLRWTIEQLFRTLKLQGLRIEDSQLASADRLLKLVAIASKAAAIVMQLVQARDGRDQQPASLAFTLAEIAALDALNTRLEGKAERQKNPHPKNTLAWATWVIAKLGGWHEYEARPPGPITFHNGLTYFRAFAAGWEFKNV